MQTLAARERESGIPLRVRRALKLIKSLSVRLVCAIILGGWNPVALADYYPLESKRRNEEGVCIVKLTATAEGKVEDPNLTLSTGYPRLDEACLAAFQGKHIKPAIRDGKPTTVTLEMAVNWRLTVPGRAPIKVDPNNRPRIGQKHYPAESARLHEEGVCVVKVKVSAGGEVHELGLTHSTGFTRLDQACLDAFTGGGLLPATVNGKAVDSTTDYPITWRLGNSRPAESEEQEDSSSQPN